MGKLKDRYIRFDWAIKRLLRDKANFAVLEGLLTVLFEDKTQIVEILESEGNQLAETDKFNRVDIKANHTRGGAEHARGLLSGTHTVRRGQDHHRTHFIRRELWKHQEGVLHQHRLFRFGQG